MESLSEKGAIRKQKKALRAAQSEQESQERSRSICEALWKLPVLWEATRVYCYAPLADEVDVWELADRLWAAGKQVAFPRVKNITQPEMDFYEVKSRKELMEGTFHVMEPLEDGREPVDWQGAPVLVPGVAFAADGARLGYGKGYYDRYFAVHAEHVRIGVAFDCQMAPELSAVCESTDIGMDHVQTESRCYAAAEAWSYETLVAKISASRRFGRAPGITCSAALMELLGHPEQELSFVHVAGTNGKGSVSAFLREICVKAGIRTGLFTSPHLQEFTERIQIGHAQIGRSDVLRLGRLVMAANHRLMVSCGLNLTMFDYCLAIALLYYREQNVQLVILETGMGGRLDSTNIIQPPLVSVITGIGLEHTEYLGDTVEKIAAEKAGIFKRGTHAVLMDQDAQAMDVLTARCRELDIPFVVSGAVEWSGQYKDRRYEIGMLGDYQRKNAAAAIDAASILAQNGWLEMTPEAVQKGVRDARWQGRMEVVSERPWVLLDGAHNVHGVTALAQSLRRLEPDGGFTFFMGVMAEKDYETMVELILPLAKHIYALTPDSERALSAQELCEMIQKKGGSASVCADVSRMTALLQAMPDDEKCVVFGSLYLIGELRTRLLLMAREGER